MSQYAQIIAALRKGVVLSPLYAFEYLHCTKLSTRIGEIIKCGMLRKNEIIERKMERSGNSKYMTYWIRRVRHG